MSTTLRRVGGVVAFVVLGSYLKPLVADDLLIRLGTEGAFTINANQGQNVEVPNAFVVLGVAFTPPPYGDPSYPLTEIHVSLDDIPDGATITRICTHGTDTSADPTRFVRTNLVSAMPMQLGLTYHAGKDSVTGTTAWCTGTLSLVVDRDARSYFVIVRLNDAPLGQLSAHTVRVEYTP